MSQTSGAPTLLLQYALLEKLLAGGVFKNPATRATVRDALRTYPKTALFVFDETTGTLVVYEGKSA